MKQASGYIAIIIFLFFLSLIFYSIDEIFIARTLSAQETFEIKKGENVGSIINRLESKKLIRNSFIVRSYVVTLGIDKEIKPGFYSIDSPYSVREIFEEFTKGGGLETRIREGATIKEIARLLEEKGIIESSRDFEGAALAFDNSNGRYEFLPQKNNISLEGYLFPDTYSFEEKSSQAIIESILDNFEKKVFFRFGNVSEVDLARAIVMASMLEKEVQTGKDMRLVSGILWKRLENQIPLQVDATLVYIKCSILEKENCRSLSNADKNLKSSYNTYLHKGLPPAPISNPGLTAISSALAPEVSPYWYYLSAVEDGRIIFSRTLNEHNLNRAVYR